MLISTKEEHIEFLNSRIILGIKKIIDINEDVFAVMLMAQSVEVLGAYLDSKPMRAKNLSSQRFAIALYNLFPKRYSLLNKSSILYSQLRACITHTLIPTSSIIILKSSNQKKYLHLDMCDDKIVISVDQFYYDLKIATTKIIESLEKEIIKPKKISVGDHF